MAGWSSSIGRWSLRGAAALVGVLPTVVGCDDGPSVLKHHDTGSGGAAAGEGGQPATETPGEGGSPPVVAKDAKPPVFDGVRDATSEGETRVRLTWDPATDESSPEDRIAYAVYAATQPGKQDFTTPWTVAPSGAEGALISGLKPATEYYFVVRAVDQAGNEDANSSEASAQTDDHSPPSFAGITQLTAATSRTLLLEWKPAHDKGASPEQIRYNAYLSDTSGGQNFKKPDATSKPGATSLLAKGVQPLSDYFAVVRAVDADGNEDENVSELTVHTPEGVSPLFSGAKRALPEAGAVHLYWAPGTDNVTEQANLVYEIYVSTSSGKFDFSTPDYVSEPAATSFLVQGLVPGQRYYFVVRARDVGGNLDGNTLEVNSRPLPTADRSAPAFGGVTSVVGTSPSTLLASWAAATDDVSLAPTIVYEVYVSDTANAQKFTAPQIVTPPGATTATLMGLPPLAARYVVVRARDQAGNVAPNKTEVKGTTLAAPDGDTEPPVWGTGPTLATDVDGDPTFFDLAWTTATDDTHAKADIRYHVCAEPLEASCVGDAFLNHVRATSDWGQLALELKGLLSRTRYFVYVRAEDRSGNLETGNHSVSASTLTSWVSDVSPILSSKCLSCHDFTVPKLVGVPGGFVDPKVGPKDTGLWLVAPGKPELSLLYRRINPLNLTTSPFSASVPNLFTGPQEPRDGANLYVLPLSGTEDGAIRDWITQGAFAN